MRDGGDVAARSGAVQHMNRFLPRKFWIFFVAIHNCDWGFSNVQNCFKEMALVHYLTRRWAVLARDLGLRFREEPISANPYLVKRGRILLLAASFQTSRSLAPVVLQLRCFRNRDRNRGVVVVREAW